MKNELTEQHNRRISEFEYYVQDFISTLPHELKAFAGERIATEAAIWGSDSMYEAFGILEESKLSIRETFKEIAEEDSVCDDCKEDLDNLAKLN